MNNSSVFEQALAHDLKLARIRAREKMEQERAKERQDKRDRLFGIGTIGTTEPEKK